jgi:UDP-N-acetylmuramoyl-L-alanyl-D-glutamate--2,6-diaminopimelate ligase
MLREALLRGVSVSRSRTHGSCWGNLPVPPDPSTGPLRGQGACAASLPSVELEALIRALAPREVTGARPVEITDLAYDSRRVTTGAAFFCVPGERVDGHTLAWEAIERGAAALVVAHELEAGVPQLVVGDVRASMPVAADAFFGEPTKVLELAGVTGTNGKTTTCFLLHSVLEAAGRPSGLVGTIEWIVGGERRPAPFTTPEAIDLQRLFREMLSAGDRAAAVEASSHGAALRRLDRVRFDALVFTNLTQDHLDLHGTMEEYFQAKRRLFTGPQPPPAAVNVGSEWGRRLADELAGSHRAPLVTFGLEESADLSPERLELSSAGSRFRAAGIEIETSLRGAFNVENALGAVAAGLLLDLDEDAIAEGIARMAEIPGRFEVVDEGQPFTVVVDYSHTPDSLEIVLRAARALGDGRVIAVFGAGGDRDRSKRPLMGRVAAELADLAIVTSDNPRSEDPLEIIQDVLQGTGVDVEIDPDRRSAIQRAVGLAEPGDVVVVAGKGHEQGQEIGGVVHPFDDRAVVRDALAALRASR